MARIPLTDKIQDLSTQLAEEAKAYRAFEESIESERQARQKKIEDLKARLTEAVDRLNGKGNSDTEDEEVEAGEVDPEEGGQTKTGLLKAIYAKNPRISNKDAVLALEGIQDEAATKRFYSTRHYLKRTDILNRRTTGAGL